MADYSRELEFRASVEPLLRASPTRRPSARISAYRTIWDADQPPRVLDLDLLRSILLRATTATNPTAAPARSVRRGTGPAVR
jgi:hypothetical protein